MPIQDFFQGLLGGLASGMVEQGNAQRKKDIAEELYRMNLASESIKSGNYELAMLFDDKILKSIGMDKERRPALEALAGLQRQTRANTERKEKAQLGEAELKQRITALQLGREEEESAIPREKRPAVREGAAKAGIAENLLVTAEIDKRKALDTEAARANLTAEQKIIELFPKVADYDLRVQEAEERREDRKAAREQRGQEFTARMAELKANREAREAAGEDTREIRREEAKLRAEARDQRLQEFNMRTKELEAAREQRNREFDLRLNEMKEARTARELAASERLEEIKAARGDRADDRAGRLEESKAARIDRAEDRAARLEELKAAREQREKEFKERMSQLETDRKKSEQEFKERMEANEANRAAITASREETALDRKLNIGYRELEKADVNRRQVHATAPKASKIGKNSHPVFDNAQDAKDFVIRANAAERRYQQIHEKVSKLEGVDPDPPIVWKYFNTTEAWSAKLGVTTGQHLAIAEQEPIKGSSSKSGTTIESNQPSTILTEEEKRLNNKMNQLGGKK